MPGSLGLGSDDFAATATFAPWLASSLPISSPIPRDAPVLPSLHPTIQHKTRNLTFEFYSHECRPALEREGHDGCREEAPPPFCHALRCAGRAASVRAWPTRPINSTRPYVVVATLTHISICWRLVLDYLATSSLERIDFCCFPRPLSHSHCHLSLYISTQAYPFTTLTLFSILSLSPFSAFPSPPPLSLSPTLLSTPLLPLHTILIVYSWKGGYLSRKRKS